MTKNGYPVENNHCSQSHKSLRSMDEPFTPSPIQIYIMEKVLTEGSAERKQHQLIDNNKTGYAVSNSNLLSPIIQADSPPPNLLMNRIIMSEEESEGSLFIFSEIKKLKASGIILTPAAIERMLILHISGKGPTEDHIKNIASEYNVPIDRVKLWFKTQKENDEEIKKARYQIWND
ncbi:hypothetical protein RF11_12832 [Thelohanellus kitauei]|uniref:Uncharacterized protein n=1 Tax=Thelohanellus kitauei TaxID=669202 RepID=A0A0C2IX08_THEKT|nr:hypothetical protein RF11_12832 [Thelohanellus kitauei]